VNEKDSGKKIAGIPQGFFKRAKGIRHIDDWKDRIPMRRRFDASMRVTSALQEIRGKVTARYTRGSHQASAIARSQISMHERQLIQSISFSLAHAIHVLTLYPPAIKATHHEIRSILEFYNPSATCDKTQLNHQSLHQDLF